MDPFQTLRKAAIDKKEQAIELAQAECSQTLHLIAELKKRLPAIPEPRFMPPKGTGQTLVDVVQAAMPGDQPLTIRDLMERLRIAHPGRNFNEPSVRTTLAKLIELGKVRKVRKGDRGFIFWAAEACPVPINPLASVSISDIAAKTLAERGPMRLLDLVVALQEIGYRDDATPRVLLNSVKQAMKRYPARFSSTGDGVWSSV